MKITLGIIRILGCLYAIRLIISAVAGISQISSLYSGMLSGSYSISPARPAFGLFGPAFSLGVMLLLPWSRIRSSVGWSISFILLLAAAILFFGNLLSPYVNLQFSSVRRAIAFPDLLPYMGFVLLQISAIAALHFQPRPGDLTGTGVRKRLA